MVKLSGLPIAAAGAATGALASLFFLLVAAKAGDELMRRLRQPVVIGEILAGVLIGPSVFGVVDASEMTELFAEIGVIFLLFWVGLNTHISDLTRVGRIAVMVGLFGVVFPVGAGLAVGLAFGEPLTTGLFIAAALAATSVGITAAVMRELGILDSRAARVILGAAVVDDVLALVLLSVAVGLADDGSISALNAIATIALAVAFIGFVTFGGTRLLRSRPALLQAPRFAESPLLPAVILCLGLALISVEIGMAAVIGAFIAGMIVGETQEHAAVEPEVAPLYAFFAPFFFVSIGLVVDLSSLASAGALGALAGLTTLACATKYVGARIGARSMSRLEARIVATGMIPRGEVGLIVAALGASAGVVDHSLYAVIVGVTLLTTVLAPPLMRRVVRGAPALPS